MSDEDRNQDKDERKWLSRFFTVAPLIIGVLLGGIGGAVLTYWMNGPQSTVLAFNVTSAAIANPAASDVIPNLSCRIGGEPVSILYSSVIEFKPVEGPYLESAQVAIRYPESTKIFGVTAQPSHQFDCKQRDADIICSATNLSSREKTAYRVNLATSSPQTPRLTVIGKDLELEDLNTYAEIQLIKGKNKILIVVIIVSCLIPGIVIAIFFEKYKQSIEKQLEKVRERRNER